jgi:hypothetical protein
MEDQSVAESLSPAQLPGQVDTTAVITSSKEMTEEAQAADSKNHWTSYFLKPTLPLMQTDRW